MKRVLSAMLGIAAVCALTATTALAAPVNVRPTTVLPGSEVALQTIFNNIGSSINVGTDQEAYAYFQSQAAGISAAQLIIELAGNAPVNEYGIYKLGDITKTASVFDGTDVPGAKAAIWFGTMADPTAVRVMHDYGWGPTVNNFGNLFGFYLKTVGGLTMYSEDLLNGGSAQALVFQAKGDNVMLPGNLSPLNDINHYYLAWEDILGGGDQDFNDGVFIVESVTGVPEPGLVGLLGMGFFAVASALRRRRL